MESSVIFTIANLKKLKAGAILAVDGNPVLGIGKGEFEPGERTGELDQRVQDAIRNEALIAIEAVRVLENMSKARRVK
jgi:uridine phosphorylase